MSNPRTLYSNQDLFQVLENFQFCVILFAIYSKIEKMTELK